MGHGLSIALWSSMNAAIISIATVPKLLVRESLLLVPEFSSFRRQETIFAGLNVCLLAALLFSDVIFPFYFGRPPGKFFALLIVGILANGVDLLWINHKRLLSPERMVALTWAMVVLNLSVAFSLASLSYRQDVQYFALMIVPIFQAAFRLSLGATILTVTASISLIFFWVWNYFRFNSGSPTNEYLEAGTISLIYIVGGLLVWTLVNHLRSKQKELAASLVELEKAKAKLLIEEKLAAVGRFSNAIAHEIRNPVAMISSALKTAATHPPDSAESREMFQIAANEATRLERLTTDFLTYAKPQLPAKQKNDIADSIAYIADICRPRAAETGVHVRSEGPEGLWANVDCGQLQQALLNLAMNAIEASPPTATVVLRGKRDSDHLRIEVENGYGPIPAGTIECIFEPFFSTKPSGTGLGLAIARNFALGHGGDLILSRNDANLVQFSIILPADILEGADQP
jgi:signal transduction histidine kinase